MSLRRKIIWFVWFLMITNAVPAASDVAYHWQSVAIEANDGVVVKISLDEDSEKITRFETIFDDVSTHLDRHWFADLDGVRLNTLALTKGCSVVNVDEPTITRACSSNIKFHIWIELESENVPRWYQDPTVSFYIKNGVVTDRLIRFNDREGHWQLKWKHADGSESNSGMVHRPYLEKDD